MQVVIDVAIPVFGIILCGYLSGRVRLIDSNGSEAINSFVYWFALPPLIFISVVETRVSEILHLDFIISVSLGVVITGIIAALVGRYLFQNRGSTNALHAMTALFSNTGYMGIPLFISAFGEERVLPAIIATVLNMLFYGVMSAWVTATNVKATGDSAPNIPKKVFHSLIKNPLVIAPILGIAISSADMVVPSPITNVCRILGAAAAPGALFALGLFLVGQSIRSSLREVGWMAFLKLFFQPLVTAFLVFYIFDMDGFWATSAILLAALPTGALVFVTAQQNKVFIQRASAAIVVTTLTSVITLMALLAWFANE